MTFSSMLLRRCCPVVLALLGFFSGHSHADDGQPVASGQVYERTPLWFIIGGVNGKACGLTIPHGPNEILFVTAEIDQGRMLFYFSYVKKNLNISIQGNYKIRIKYSNGDVFIRNATPVEAGYHSGVHIRDLGSDFVADFSTNSSFSMKIGDVDYGSYDLSRSRNGIPRLFDCMMDTAKWDITSSMPLRKQIGR